MANEISISYNLTVTPQGATAAYVFAENGRAVNLVTADAKIIRHIQVIPSTAEAIQIGELVNLGYCVFRNLDATNSVNIRMGAGGADVVKLKPGEASLVRLAGNTPFAIASAGTVRLEYMIVED